MRECKRIVSLVLSLAIFTSLIVSMEVVAVTGSSETSFTCMLKRAEALINYEWVPSERKATCVAKAVYYKSCSVCGTASTDTFATGEIDSATHEKEGNIEYFVCSGCDKLFAEEDATTEITLADTIIKKQEVNVDNKSDDEKAESPKTYDSSMYIIWAVLLFISISMFISMKAYGKKEKKF